MSPEIAQWASAMAAVIALLLSVWTAMTARSRKEFDEIVAQASVHERRLTQVESALTHLPDADRISAMQLAIADMKGQIGVIVERVEPIRAIAQRLQDALLERQS